MIIGVIGKSGSGKSTASKFLVEKGFHLIDLDKIGKQIVDKPKVKILLRRAFGYHIFDNGILDRALLGNIVFNNEKSLSILTKITSDFIKKEVLKQLKKYEKIVIDGYKLVGCEELCNEIIGIKSNLETSLQRLQKRESNTELKTLKNRILNQTFDEKICTHIIENNNTVDVLKATILFIIGDLK